MAGTTASGDMDTAGTVCKIDGIPSIYKPYQDPRGATQKGLILNLDSVLISLPIPISFWDALI